MNKALMEAYYHAYNSEDPEQLRQFYCSDVELRSAQGTQYGIDAILETYAYLTATFFDQMTPTDIQISGNTAVVEISDRFTAKADVDDFLGMALKKGESMELKLRGTYVAKDGKFATIHIENLGA